MMGKILLHIGKKPRKATYWVTILVGSVLLKAAESSGEAAQSRVN